MTRRASEPDLRRWVRDNATNVEAERWVLWGDGEPPSGLDAEAGNDVARHVAQTAD